MMRSAGVLILASALTVSASNAAGPQSLQETAQQLAQTALVQHQLPAVAVYIQRSGRMIAQVAIGVRKLGIDTPVTTADQWHIGSCTKAMTATMIARLVERGVLSFDAKMGALFPDFADKMDISLRNATLTQMLSHTAGLGDVETLEQLAAMVGDTRDVMAQRRALAHYVLVHPPEAAPGTRYKYSNLGYVIAAAAAEARTHKPWEQLVREEVFTPLHMTSAGFGPPGSPGRVDEPYGHIADGTKVTPAEPEDIDATLPPVLAPAGGVHATLADWARFVQDQIDGARGHGRLLGTASYRRMQTPVAPSAVYGLGWGVKLGSGSIPLILTHNGSTDPWFAEVRAYPQTNTFTLVATNRGDDDNAGVAVKDIGKGLAAALGN